MATTTFYRDVNTGRGPSPGLWHDCDWVEIGRDPNKGVLFWDDFLNIGPITSPTTEAHLVGAPYIGFGSTGATITQADVQFGAIALTEATDNEAVYMKIETCPLQISANLGDLWFEARCKVNAITDNQIGFIVGLMDTTAMTVIVPLSTANPPVLSACNFVGFHGAEEDAGAVKTAYIADGVAPVAVQSTVHQFVADTYAKFGMRFTRRNNTLSFFVNGVAQTSTKVVPDNTGTDFPADVRLSPVVGHRLGAGTSSITTIDWWRFAQLVP